MPGPLFSFFPSHLDDTTAAMIDAVFRVTSRLIKPLTFCLLVTGRMIMLKDQLLCQAISLEHGDGIFKPVYGSSW